MNEQVALVQPKPQGWRSSSKYTHAPVKAAVPFWRAVRGYKIHRARSAVVFINDRGRICVTWWCGNSAQNPIAFKPECAEGLTWCGVCEGKYRQSETKR